MAETSFVGTLGAEQEGDIVLDPKTRLGNVGGLDTTTVEVLEGNDLVDVNVVSKTLVTVRGKGTAGNATVRVVADKNLDPAVEDNEVGIFNIVLTPAGTQAVNFSFTNVRDIEVPAPPVDPPTEG